MQQVVMITGATAGVGRATARAFARRGAHVGLLARGKDGLAATREDVERLGGRALELPADVASAEEVEAAAVRLEEAFGPIDVWVNNAMTAVFAEFKDVEPDEFRRVTDVVYHGQVWGARSALRRMLPRNKGTIVFVGSALAYRGIPLQSAYCGAKHATQGLFESLRTELMHTGSDVRLTMVHLPALNTPQFTWVRSKLPRKAQPVPPIFEPEVAADAIVWATDHPRRELYVGLPTVQAIVGNKIFPALGDWYLARSGYDSQQRSEPEDRSRPDNLFEPVPGDFGAHGEFGDRAADGSLQLWAAKNRTMLTAACAALFAFAGALLSSRR